MSVGGNSDQEYGCLIVQTWQDISYNFFFLNLVMMKGIQTVINFMIVYCHSPLRETMSFPGGKAVAAWADQTPPSSAEVKNEWNLTSISLLCFHDVYRIPLAIRFKSTAVSIFRFAEFFEDGFVWSKVSAGSLSRELAQWLQIMRHCRRVVFIPSSGFICSSCIVNDTPSHPRKLRFSKSV